MQGGFFKQYKMNYTNHEIFTLYNDDYITTMSNKTTLIHEANVLTEEDVIVGRSNAYKFLEL